jgi:hypothetical protein
VSLLTPEEVSARLVVLERAAAEIITLVRQLQLDLMEDTDAGNTGDKT